ncbi:MAG TPA: ABC transporter ATP-binding protein [Rhodospirillales bacterium]|jgi:branched-chain amino acid transport system ATP-binding protein|nr:ABC transporter ATP-binding protein [Rhodospirillales bacterium]
MMLETTNLTKSFGGLVAANNINLQIREGEIRGIIGPNGSGKSTLFNLISGVYTPNPGSRIHFNGEEITGLEPHEIARRGIARTFQLLRLFLDMSVLENLLVGHHSHVGYNLGAAVIGAASVRAEERRLREEMMELLSFIGLADYAEMPASELSIGMRRLLSLGRAIAMRPKLLMLDEPAAGLSPVNVDTLLKTVLSLKERYGLTLVIIEHIMKVVMETCDTVTVLEHGEKIAEGVPDDVRDDHRVIEAYLGKEMEDSEVRAFLEAS